LVRTEWVIEDIAGRGVVDNSLASLVFLQRNQLAGNTSCNA
jgi:heat shock protein HslJ